MPNHHRENLWANAESHTEWRTRRTETDKMKDRDCTFLGTPEKPRTRSTLEPPMALGDLVQLWGRSGTIKCVKRRRALNLKPDEAIGLIALACSLAWCAVYYWTF